MPIAQRPHTIEIWLLASRPKTWFASISPVLLGSAMAMKDGFFHPWLFLFILLTGLGIQIGTNLTNDYYDWKRGADTEKRQGPLRVTQAGLVSPARMKVAIFMAFGITALSSCYLIAHGGIIMAVLVAIAILMGLAYTAGPFPIGYICALASFLSFSSSDL